MKKNACSAQSILSRVPTHLSEDEAVDLVRHLDDPMTEAQARRFLSKRRQRILAPVSLSEAALARHDHIPVHDLAVPENLQEGVLLVRAPMGSGKTQKILAPLARELMDITAVSPRVSLTGELAARLKLTDYRAGTPDEVEKGVAICAPSIGSEKWMAHVAESQVLLLDEIEQILRFLPARECSTRISGSEEIYDILKGLIRRARLVVGADAYLSDLTLRLLEEARPNERFKIMTMAPRQVPVRVLVHAGKAAIDRAMCAVLARIADGEKVWVATDSVAQADVMAQLIREYHPEKRLLVITRPTKEGGEQKMFLSDADRMSRLYDVVIASPVISSGISVEHREALETEMFDVVAFLGGSGLSVTPTDAFQQIRRVRYVREVILGCEQSNATARIDEQGLIRGKLDCEKIEGRDGVARQFEAFAAHVAATESQAKAEFFAGLLYLMEEEGWILERQVDDENLVDLKAARTQAKSAQIEAVMAALPIDEGTAEIYRSGSVTLTPEIHARLQAFEVRKGLALRLDTPLTEELLKVWDWGQGRRRAELYIALRGEEDSILAELDKNLMHRRHVLAASRLLRRIFAGVDLTDPLDPYTCQGIIALAWKERFAMAAAGLVPAWWGTLSLTEAPKDAVREMTGLFERLGLKLKKEAQTRVDKLARTDAALAGGILEEPDQKKRVRVYRAEPATITLMGSYADRIGRQIRHKIETARQMEKIRMEEQGKAEAEARLRAEAPRHILEARAAKEAAKGDAVKLLQEILGEVSLQRDAAGRAELPYLKICLDLPLEETANIIARAWARRGDLVKAGLAPAWWLSPKLKESPEEMLETLRQRVSDQALALADPNAWQVSSAAYARPGSTGFAIIRQIQEQKRCEKLFGISTFAQLKRLETETPVTIEEMIDELKA